MITGSVQNGNLPLLPGGINFIVTPKISLCPACKSLLRALTPCGVVRKVYLDSDPPPWIRIPDPRLWIPDLQLWIPDLQPWIPDLQPWIPDLQP